MTCQGFDIGAKGLEWFVRNWAVPHWYLDASTGNDFADGTTPATALRSGAELMRRLALPLPCDHSVTVHCGPGNFGTLALSYLPTNELDRLDVLGTYSVEDLGTVASYSARVAATNSEAYLEVSGVADWAARKGALLMLTGGASVGAVGGVLEGNPHAVGITRAAVTYFSVANATSLVGSTKVPAPGDAVAQVTLQTRFERLSIETSHGLIGGASGSSLRNRAVLKYLDVGLLELTGSPCVVDSCRYERIQSSVPSKQAMQVRCMSSGYISGTYRAVSIDNVSAYWCGFVAHGAAAYSCSIGAATVSGCNFWGFEVAPQPRVPHSFSDTGVSGSSRDGLRLVQFVDAQLSGFYGADNAGYGINLMGYQSVQVTGCYVTGALGFSSLAGAVFDRTMMNTDTYQDGAYRGSATLVAGTKLVSVIYCSAAQQVRAFHKTPLGTPGFLTAVRVSDSQIRIDSTSAADVSEVYWEISPRKQSLFL